jgi:undecaprenyl-diphosphatase
MLKKLIETDQYLFDLINQQWVHPFLDVVMPLLRNQYTWVPVYFFLLLFGYFNFRNKLLPWVGFFLLTFALTDLISTQIFKEYIQRPRPCWDNFTASHVRMLIPCSHAYSFVSSHATNHFGMSAFIFITLRNFFSKSLWIVFLWAFLVALAQIYVGAHYPGDVIGGAVLGLLIGIFSSGIFKKYFSLHASAENKTQVM